MKKTNSKKELKIQNEGNTTGENKESSSKNSLTENDGD
jgi:hypothetical protein